MPATEQSGSRDRRRRVLVVEDEFMVAILLEDMLAGLGYEVVGPVARLEQAVEMAQHEAVDVAILDVNLDGQDTWPVATALAARDISFVFATGYSGKKLPKPFDNRPILHKPFQERDLRRMLTEMFPEPGG